MAQVARMEGSVPPPVNSPVLDIRRFEVPDVNRHGDWMLKRILAAYPHINARQVVSWLRGMVYMNEFLFLFQENAVALAQAVRPDAFSPSIVIWERFVWVQDPNDRAQLMDAARFYERFRKWAEQQDAKQIVVGEQSDVPHEMIVGQLGRLLERTQVYARL